MCLTNREPAEMTEDRERLRYLRTLLAQAGVDWDLIGDPPEISESAEFSSLLRRAIAEIGRNFSVTLAAITAGEIEAPIPLENVGRFNRLSESIQQLGVFFDGTEDPPDLAEATFDSHEEREQAEDILAEMLGNYPKTIARRRADGYITLLPSMLNASPWRDPPCGRGAGQSPTRGSHRSVRA